MKIYIPNISNTGLGGGFSFLRNLRKGLKDKVGFVDKWQDSDIVFIFGITTIDKAEIHEAVKAGKKLVLRVDNIPRCSRNKRQTPYERLKEFGNLADVVVYQSNWCKEYAGYFINNKNEVIVNNGVDASIFNTDNRNSDGKTYLYINYNDNPNKRFDEAIYRFDMAWREDNNIHLVIAGNVPKIYLEHPEYNWDLTSDATVEYAGIMETPEDVANLMKRCDLLLYPSFAEAYPNTLLEGMACGLETTGINFEGGSFEAYENSIKKVKTIQEMSDEYLEVFNELI